MSLGDRIRKLAPLGLLTIDRATLESFAVEADNLEHTLEVAREDIVREGVARQNISVVHKLAEREVEDQARLINRLSELLNGVALALKGPPAEDSLHDWSDLPATLQATMDLLPGVSADQPERFHEVPHLGALERQGDALGLVLHRELNIPGVIRSLPRVTR